MKSSRLGGLAVLAIGLVAVAVWFGRSGEPQSESPSEGLLWPQLADQVGQVERIGFRVAGDVELETLELRDGHWRVMAHDGWWADSARVDTLLRDLRRARKLEAKTAISERHGLLGVADISSAEGTGTAVDITYAGTTRQLLVGNANPHSSGRFVRFSDEAQAWLVDASLDLPADPRQWLARELLDIASRRVARLDITPQQGRSVKLVRAPGVPAGHVLAEAPEGRAADASRVETAATLFEGLRLDDVMRDPGIAPDADADPIRVRLHTVDGLAVDMDSWRDGGVRWIRMQVAFDQEVALAWVEAEIQRDQVALDAARLPVPDNGEGAAPPLDAESAGIGPLDAAQRMDELRLDAAALGSRLQGWAFSLSPRKQAIIEAPFDDYLTPAD